MAVARRDANGNEQQQSGIEVAGRLEALASQFRAVAAPPSPTILSLAIAFIQASSGATTSDSRTIATRPLHCQCNKSRASIVLRAISVLALHDAARSREVTRTQNAPTAAIVTLPLTGATSNATPSRRRGIDLTSMLTLLFS